MKILLRGIILHQALAVTKWNARGTRDSLGFVPFVGWRAESRQRFRCLLLVSDRRVEAQAKKAGKSGEFS